MLVYRFETADGKPCAAVYTDGITDKQLLGELAARPLSLSPAPATREEAEKLLLFPEIKSADDVAAAAKEILSGNPALLIEGICGAIILGTKKVTLRAISEPQTSITVKGPREGFIEDVKTNMSLVRRRLITPDLRFETLTLGKRSQTAVCIAYLAGIADEKLVGRVCEKLKKRRRTAYPIPRTWRSCSPPRPPPPSSRWERRKNPTCSAPKCWKGASGFYATARPLRSPSPT